MLFDVHRALTDELVPGGQRLRVCPSDASRLAYDEQRHFCLARICGNRRNDQACTSKGKAASRLTLCRILIWVFLIDSALVLFNNIPPRIALRELKMDLACPEMCFQAETAEKCLQLLEKWVSQSQRYGQPSLFSLIRSICKDKVDEESLEWFAHLGFINLWSVVNGKKLLLLSVMCIY